VLNERENEEQVDRVDDVMSGVRMYSQMIATFFHLSEGNPVVPLIGANFMAQFISKLVEWGVLTDAQHAQVMFRMAEEAAERRAALEEAAGGDNKSGLTDPTKDLIKQLGI
jgi:hypothetical protein